MKGLRVALVAAVADNGVIGERGGMPWRLATDMKRFKALTMGKPVVMGRRTWESLGKPLSGRDNIVVTRQKAYRANGAEVAGSFGEALLLAAAKPGASEIAVIGGGEIYGEAIEEAERLYITHVHARPKGDTTFPAIDPETWGELSREEVPAGPKDDFPTTFIVYERREARQSR
jgi:dihydrofolate reductase